MIDTENISEEQIVQPTEQQEEVQSQEQAPVEDKTASNMRRLREKSERMERERDDMYRRLQESESKYAQPKSSDEDDDINLEPDALAEGKHLRKVMQKIKKLEDENRQHRQRTAVDITEARLKSQYGDFDRVVTKENIESLRDEFPEIAESINSNPDLYKRAVSAYTIIKKMGIHQESEQFEGEKAMVKKNAAKPRPMASLSPQHGDSPLSKANAFADGLTKELKAQLHKEMIEAMKRN